METTPIVRGDFDHNEKRSKGPWSGDPKPSRAFECTTSKLKTEVEKRTPKVPHKISFTERRFWDIFWQSVCKKKYLSEAFKKICVFAPWPPGGSGGSKRGCGVSPPPRQRRRFTIFKLFPDFRPFWASSEDVLMLKICNEL